MSKDYKDFIPYEKRSKKQKREFNNEKRRFWDINPVTQVIPDKKKRRYEKKHKRDNYYEDWGDE